MKFLRENLFLIVLVAAVLVVGIVMVVWDRRLAGEVEGMVQERQALSGRLRMFSRQRLANRKVLAAKKKDIENAQSAQQTVREASVQWNCRHYRVIELKVEGENKLIPAFPYAPDLYKKHLLDLTFSREYRRLMKEQLDSLRPTAAPILKEIDERSKSLELILNRREGDRRPADAPGPGVMGVPPEGMPPEAVMPPDVQAGTGLTARDTARRELMMERARQGQVYASEQSLDMVFRVDRTNVAPDELWRAQVNLWTTTDILAAIRETNEQAFRAGGSAIKTPNVLNAAVKRLVQMRVDPGYFTGASAFGGTGAAPMPMPMPTPTPMLEETLPPPGTPYEGFEPPPEMPMAPSSDLIGGPRMGGAGSGSLTERTTNARYDVVRYSFTVVMPTRHLEALERNLMSRNYHVIYNVEMTEPTRIDDFHYYGTDPVLEVRLDGELLLLTDWQRGTWDSPSRQWVRQPLVPAEVLRLLPSSVLRPEDSQRVSPTGGGIPFMPSGG